MGSQVQPLETVIESTTRDTPQAPVLWRSLFDEARRSLKDSSRRSHGASRDPGSSENAMEVMVKSCEVSDNSALGWDSSGGFYEARRLVEAASGASPAEFHDVLDQPATQRSVAHFHTMLQRLLSGEPLQYVIGSWGFRHLDLMVDQRVLIPRPETEVVAGWAIQAATERASANQEQATRQQGAGQEVTVVDLGTGSGAIGLSVALECSHARVYASDVSHEALAVARANLAGLGQAAARVTLHQGDWFEALPDALRGKVDVIVSNPPYVATDEHLPAVVADWEPSIALHSGPNGCEALRQIVVGASTWLRPGGVLITEVASQRAQESASVFTAEGFSDVRVESDLAGRDRVVIGRL